MYDIRYKKVSFWICRNQI